MFLAKCLKVTDGMQKKQQGGEKLQNENKTYKTKVVKILIRGKYLQMFAGYDLSSSITLENITVDFAQDVNHK